MPENASHILSFSEITRDRHAEVGGKNASLGEPILALKEAGIAVPDGLPDSFARVRERIGEAGRIRRSRVRASAAE